MELKRKGPEFIEVVARTGLRVLFSYGQAVAIYEPLHRYAGGEWYAERWLRTDEYVSATTERHITEFLAGGVNVQRVAREEILQRVREVC